MLFGENWCVVLVVVVIWVMSRLFVVLVYGLLMWMVCCEEVLVRVGV